MKTRQTILASTLAFILWACGGNESPEAPEPPPDPEALEKLVGQVLEEYEHVFGDRARPFRQVPSDPEARVVAQCRQV